MYSFQKVETVAFEKVRRLPYETSNSVNVLKCVGIQFLSPLFVLVFARLPKNVQTVFGKLRLIFGNLRKGSGDCQRSGERGVPKCSGDIR